MTIQSFSNRMVQTSDSLHMTQETRTEPKPLLSTPPSCKAIVSEAYSILKHLVHYPVEHVTHSAFFTPYKRFLELFQLFQNEVIKASGYQMYCTKGCRSCCYHWVEDVYSFEIIIIAQYIKNHYADLVESIKNRCVEDEQILIRLETRIERKNYSGYRYSRSVDTIDLLLENFYKEKRACPLLTSLGDCRIYSVRPLTCRMYMSFSHPSLCSPDSISSGSTDTYLLDMSEEINDLLDKLHTYYATSQKSGLRALLIDAF